MKKLKINFYTSEQPIQDVTTKFGGQPNWYTKPEWPLSRSLNKPMSFICQIKIDKSIFPESQAEMAYIFMTDDEEYVDGTWEAEGGENAIILQPGNTTVPITKLITGPTLTKYVQVEGQQELQPQEIELRVTLNEDNDPSFISEDDDITNEEIDEYHDKTEGNKIGGSPAFIQGDEFPDESDNWLLLLQLDSCDDNYSLNFGDAGVSYSFINKEGTKAKFIWQCG